MEILEALWKYWKHCGNTGGIVEILEANCGIMEVARGMEIKFWRL